MVKQFLANGKTAAHHHPPSSDIKPTDYFLFPKHRFALKGWNFQAITEILDAIIREMNSIQEETFPEEIQEFYESCKQVYKSR
jgi:hypothetical protein